MKSNELFLEENRNYMSSYIENDKIKEVGEDKISVAENVIDKMIDDDSELITVFYGEDVKEEEVKDALVRNGFEIVEITYSGEWVAITAK